MHPPIGIVDGSRTLWMTLATATLAIGACSSGDDPVPNIVDAVPTLNEVSEVRGLMVAETASWSHGRAVRATTSSNGALTVVTTTGVFQTTGPGRDVRQLDRFDGPVQPGPIALSQDHTALAYATISPPVVRTYDVVSGSLLASLPLPEGSTPRSVHFGSRSNELTVAVGSGPHQTTNLATAPQPVLDVPTTGRFDSLPDGRLVIPVTGTQDLAVNRAGVTERRRLALAPDETVFDVQASPDGAVLAVSVGAGQNRFERQDRIVLLDAATFEPRASVDTGVALEPHLWAVTNNAVVSAAGPTLEGWSLHGAPLGVSAPDESSIASVHPAADYLITVHTTGTLTRWSADPWLPTIIDPGGTSLEHVALSPGGTIATTVDRYGLVTTWNLADGTRIATEDRFAIGEATGVAISSDGDTVAVTSSYGQITVLDANLAQQRTLRASDGPALVGAVAFSPTSGALTTGLAERLTETSFDDEVTVWADDFEQPRFSFGGEAESVAGCSFYFSRVRYSPNGRTLAVTSHDFSVFVLDTTYGTILHELPGTTTVLDLAFSPDGSRLVVSYDNATFTVWETSTYGEVARVPAAQGGYFAIAVLPGSKAMVATDITGAIAIIDLASGGVISQFENDATFSTMTLAISPDGALVAAPTDEGDIALWSTTSGERLATAGGHTGEVIGLAFDPAGAWMASSSTDGTVRTWDLDRLT